MTQAVLAIHGGAGTHPHDSLFRKRSIEDPLPAESFLQPFGRTPHRPGVVDPLSEKEHRRVAFQSQTESFVDALDVTQDASRTRIRRLIPERVD